MSQCNEIGNGQVCVFDKGHSIPHSYEIIGKVQKQGNL